MADYEWLAERFEENRRHLRAVAYRVLGSLSEADDAVQETWLRLSCSDSNAIENLGGWLTTVIARVCLDMLRSRTSRREEPLEDHGAEPSREQQVQADPEQETLLADSVGLALLVVLDRLSPFEEISTIVRRSPIAARQLASRARRRVQGVSTVPKADHAQKREIIETFLAALRRGDVQELLAVLDPEVVVRVDEAGARSGHPREIRGARNWARGAVAFSQAAQSMQPALVDGSVGLVWAPSGRLSRVLGFVFASGKIAGIDIIADPTHLSNLNLTILHDTGRNTAS